MHDDELIPHPEGGRYREIYRSADAVTRADGAARSALTHIYFSLRHGEVSRFHRVTADEVWNLYEGAALLYLWDGIADTVEAIELSAASGRYCHIVPANHWQATAPLSARTLVGCTVAPGFEFADFTLIAPTSPEASRLLAIDPKLQHLIQLQ